jgi:glycosyltransferase involved in cell wall biosynthesis
MERNTPIYILISPVRNEEKNIEFTIESVLSQTIKPAEWIIVDDGSSDGTDGIIDRYCIAHSLISLIRLKDKGYYDLVGGSEIKAFYHGFARIKTKEYAYIGKLDGDISFDEYYYEKLLKEFNINKKLGIASGICYIHEGNKIIAERTYWQHPRGSARLYRRECWNDIGGARTELSWDAIDAYKARMLGWDTAGFSHIRMMHHVKTWVKGGKLRGLMRSGKIEYLMGTHPLFFAAKAIKVAFRRPYILLGVFYIFGYVQCVFRKEIRVAEPELICFIRNEQMKRFRILHKLLRKNLARDA